MTVLDFITDVLVHSGALAQGETPNNDEAQQVLRYLNNLLDSWSTEQLNLYKRVNYAPALTPGKQSYQIGTGATDFSTVARPVLIQTATIVLPGTTVRVPMDVCNAVDWAAIPEKGIQGVLPRKLYCDYGWPIATLNVSPIPTGAPVLDLVYWAALAEFAALTDTVDLPYGYRNALLYNLVVALPPNLRNDVDQATIAMADRSKAGIRSLNAQYLGGAVGQQTTGQIPVVGMGQVAPPPAAPQQ